MKTELDAMPEQQLSPQHMHSGRKGATAAASATGGRDAKCNKDPLESKRSSNYFTCLTESTKGQLKLGYGVDKETLSGGRREAGLEFACISTLSRVIYWVQTTSPTEGDTIFTPCILRTACKEKLPNYSLRL